MKLFRLVDLPLRDCRCGQGRRSHSHRVKPGHLAASLPGGTCAKAGVRAVLGVGWVTLRRGFTQI